MTPPKKKKNGEHALTPPMIACVDPIYTQQKKRCMVGRAIEVRPTLKVIFVFDLAKNVGAPFGEKKCLAFRKCFRGCVPVLVQWPYAYGIISRYCKPAR